MAHLRQNRSSQFQILLIGVGIALLILSWSCTKPVAGPTPVLPAEEETAMKLPEPQYDSNVSLEESLLQRRSIRSYTDEPLTLQ